MPPSLESLADHELAVFLDTPHGPNDREAVDLGRLGQFVTAIAHETAEFPEFRGAVRIELSSITTGCVTIVLTAVSVATAIILPPLMLHYQRWLEQRAKTPGSELANCLSSLMRLDGLTRCELVTRSDRISITREVMPTWDSDRVTFDHAPDRVLGASAPTMSEADSVGNILGLDGGPLAVDGQALGMVPDDEMEFISVPPVEATTFAQWPRPTLDFEAGGFPRAAIDLPRDFPLYKVQGRIRKRADGVFLFVDKTTNQRAEMRIENELASHLAEEDMSLTFFDSGRIEENRQILVVVA